MGDRANVFIPDAVEQGKEPTGVYLYTHGSGYHLPRVVAEALGRKVRWDDGQYLARIIFCQMLQSAGPNELRQETGFGISGQIGDNEYPILVVDPERQEVRMAEEGTEREPKDALLRWSFRKFVQTRPSWPEDPDGDPDDES